MTDFSRFQPPWDWRKILQYFLQGLIILAPITITLWAVLSLFGYVDNLLPNLLYRLFPGLFGLDDSGRPYKIPGLGFVLVVVIVITVGYISSSYIVGKIVDFFGHLLERTPGIKIIYSSVKDFMEAFAGNKRKFDKPVMVNVDGSDVWRMGFMTQVECSALGLPGHAAVYVPHSYAISGIVYVVPRDKIRLMDEISSGDAMKFAVSGGVTEVENKVQV
ncbi:DUF502 domain-containing protein [Segetibacter sp. 3557_3]|uniref:DUF502 domain-containing protein n=1 Tax=Segetibacter sp. 3557_3 TaxID=2547429 RepID=UPI001058E2BE|nr:DUF502 domain-containing protein [Segetibacter sp. 3557_3]TDH26185.1 DUF502 domain-containing protein [Segetibacter sp. 3557_3]